MARQLTDHAERNIGSCRHCRENFINDWYWRNQDIVVSFAYCEAIESTPGEGQIVAWWNGFSLFIDDHSHLWDQRIPRRRYGSSVTAQEIAEHGISNVSVAIGDRMREAFRFALSEKRVTSSWLAFANDLKILSGGRGHGSHEPPF